MGLIPKEARNSAADCAHFLRTDRQIKKYPKAAARLASAYLGKGDGEKQVSEAYNKTFEGKKLDYHQMVASLAQTGHRTKVAVVGIAALGIGIVGTSGYDASKQRRIAREEAMMPQQRQQMMAAPQYTSQQAYPQSTRTQ